MNCLTCQHENTGGRFCENCGSRLVVEATYDGSPSSARPQYQQAPVSQPNPHVEKAKAVSTMYFRFFIDVIKRPIAATQNVNHSQLTNGLISIALFAFIIPLIIFMNAGYAKDFIDSPFLTIVVKPGLALACFMFLLASYIFISLRFGGLTLRWYDVVARFGSLLIPFIGLFILSFLMSLLDMKLYPVLLMFGLMVSIFLLPPLIIYSFKRDSTGGLDALYGTILTYIATFITFLMMAAIMLATIYDIIRSQVDSFFGGIL